MTLKNITKISLAVASVAMFSCSNDFEDKRLDFSASAPLYVELAATDTLGVTEGDTITIQVQTPVATYKQPITIGYSIGGAFSTTGTVVIAEGARAASFEVVLPNDKVISPLKYATVSLTSVDAGLTVGRAGMNTSSVLAVFDDSKVISFAVDSTGGFESDGWVYAIVKLSNPATANMALQYSISGGTNGVDYTDPGGGVLQIKKGDELDTIAFQTIDNLQQGLKHTLTFTLTGITNPDPDDHETSLSTKHKIFKYTIIDDLKYVLLAGGSNISMTGLKETNYAGYHSFDVAFSGVVHDKVTVNYTVAGTGVTDVTGGSIVFLPSASTTQQITLDFTSAAFAADQTVTVTLTSITGNDQEVVFPAGGAGTVIELGLKH